jgi:hypothetical protein
LGELSKPSQYLGPLAADRVSPDTALWLSVVAARAVGA